MVTLENRIRLGREIIDAKIAAASIVRPDFADKLTTAAEVEAVRETRRHLEAALRACNAIESELGVVS